MNFHKKVNSILIVPEIQLKKKSEHRLKTVPIVKKLSKCANSDLLLLKLINKDICQQSNKSVFNKISDNEKSRLRRFMSVVRNVSGLKTTNLNDDKKEKEAKIIQQSRSEPYFVRRLKAAKSLSTKVFSSIPELLITRKKINTALL